MGFGWIGGFGGYGVWGKFSILPELNPITMPLSTIRWSCFLLFIGFFAGMAACRSGSDRAVASRDSGVSLKSGSPGAGGVMDDTLKEVPADRPSLIRALKALGRVLGTGDKQQIAGLFRFPITDSVAHFYLDDTAFKVEEEKNGGVTAGMFDHYYDGIRKSVDFAEFAAVFKELDVNKLMRTKGLEIEDADSTEECLRRYRIEIESDMLVRIIYGVSAVNPNYKPKGVKDTAAAKVQDDDNQEGACEHAIFWVYRWDGKELRMVRQDAAD
jgi:hypothetical protein